MTITFPPFRAWAVALLALAGLGGLAGCGPGLGGTGTGDMPVPGSGLGSPVALCAAETRWVDAATGGQRVRVVQGNSATWRDACAALRFDGDWAQAAQGQRFYGSTLAEGALARVVASLALQTDTARAALTLSLYGPGGQPLGPAQALLPATAALPQPAACPG